MIRNNIKILTAKELYELNNRYSFGYDDESVIVENRNYCRITRHPRDKTFSLNSKVRKVSINPEMIENWIELCKAGKEYSLLDVMQATNRLYLMFQPNDMEHLKEMLDRESIRVRNV